MRIARCRRSACAAVTGVRYGCLTNSNICFSSLDGERNIKDSEFASSSLLLSHVTRSACSVKDGNGC